MAELFCGEGNDTVFRVFGKKMRKVLWATKTFRLGELCLRY